MTGPMFIPGSLDPPKFVPFPPPSHPKSVPIADRSTKQGNEILMDKLIVKQNKVLDKLLEKYNRESDKIKAKIEADKLKLKTLTTAHKAALKVTIALHKKEVKDAQPTAIKRRNEISSEKLTKMLKELREAHKKKPVVTWEDPEADEV